MSTANQSPEGWPDRKNRAYELGPFLLDTDRQLLLKELQPIPLTPKSYDTLLVLVESGGRLLSKEELMKPYGRTVSWRNPISLNRSR